jgi:hypothetical protein
MVAGICPKVFATAVKARPADQEKLQPANTKASMSGQDVACRARNAGCHRGNIPL